MEAREKLFRANHELLPDVGVSTYEGRVLLAGRIGDKQLRGEAVRRAWTVPGVREVIAEIDIADERAVERSREPWTTIKLETRINPDKDIGA